jgi:hypothetical protein
MRKSPIEHKVSSHYREGKHIDRYTRGEGSRPRGGSLRRMAKAADDGSFKAVLYYPDGREAYTVEAGNYVEAVASGVGQAERGGLPKRVRVRRIK